VYEKIVIENLNEMRQKSKKFHGYFSMHC